MPDVSSRALAHSRDVHLQRHGNKIHFPVGVNGVQVLSIAQISSRQSVLRAKNMHIVRFAKELKHSLLETETVTFILEKCADFPILYHDRKTIAR